MGRKLILGTFAMLLGACGSSNGNNNPPADTGVQNNPADSGMTAHDSGGGGGNDAGMTGQDAEPQDNGGPVDTGIPPQPVCGNNTLEGTETCDDGNTTSGDGCDSMCQMEAGALGCREVSIRTGQDGDDADSSVFYTTAFSSPTTDLSEFINANGWQIGGPLMLCAGTINGDKALLTLQADVTFAVSLPLSNCLCRKYLAAGSMGTLYCGPSTDKLDFKLTVDSMGDQMNTDPMTVEGMGAVMREGDVRVTLQTIAIGADLAAADCTPAMCDTMFGAETPIATDYSTGQAVSEVTNSRQGGTITIDVSGKPFDDDPMDGTADCEDWMNANVKGALAGAPGFDFDNAQVGQPKDVVTVERIAE